MSGPPLRSKVAALPLIGGETVEVQARINTSLTTGNAALSKTLRECDADYKSFNELAREGGHGTIANSGDWERKVRVTMVGPLYLSIYITDFSFCGGAHPNFSATALVYELETGLPLDWSIALPGAHRAKDAGAEWNGMPIQLIADERLQRWYLDHLTEDECRTSLKNFGEISFLVFPDGRTKSLRVEAGALPHVLQGCAATFSIGATDAQKIGFSKTIVKAIYGQRQRKQ